MDIYPLDIYPEAIWLDQQGVLCLGLCFVEHPYSLLVRLHRFIFPPPWTLFSTYVPDYFTVYTYTESLCYRLKTNILLYVSYISKKIFTAIWHCSNNQAHDQEVHLNTEEVKKITKDRLKFF